jgi:hypothetical protein
VRVAHETNADDRLPVAPLDRVEGGDSFVEGRDVADVRPQSSVTRPPDNLTQLGAIGYDDEVNRPAISGPCLGRAGDDSSPCVMSSTRLIGLSAVRGPLPYMLVDDDSATESICRYELMVDDNPTTAPPPPKEDLVHILVVSMANGLRDTE